MMMSHQQQAMVERVDELERMIVRLNGRIGELQRELKHTKGMTFQGWSGGSHPIRENRRIERHDLCLF